MKSVKEFKTFLKATSKNLAVIDFHTPENKLCSEFVSKFNAISKKALIANEKAMLETTLPADRHRYKLVFGRVDITDMTNDWRNEYKLDSEIAIGFF